MRILWIEPDTVLADAYARAFADNFDIRFAHTAQQAVLLADDWLPDVVCLDLQVHGHNGVEFLYEFRSYIEWSKVPILLLTMVPPRSLMLTTNMMDRLGIIDCMYKPSTTLRVLGRRLQEADRQYSGAA